MSEPTQVVSFRLEPDTIAELRDIANAEGCTVSDLLRRGALMAMEEPNRMVVTWTTPPAVATVGSPHTVAVDGPSVHGRGRMDLGEDPEWREGIQAILKSFQDAANRIAVDQFRRALLDGLEDLDRIHHWNGHVDSGDLAQLIEAVAAEVGR